MGAQMLFCSGHRPLGWFFLQNDLNKMLSSEQFNIELYWELNYFDTINCWKIGKCCKVFWIQQEHWWGVKRVHFNTMIKSRRLLLQVERGGYSFFPNICLLIYQPLLGLCIIELYIGCIDNLAIWYISYH